MRTTLKDQISQATRAYIMALNTPSDGMATHRYAVYLQQENSALAALWPLMSDGSKDTLMQAKDAGLYDYVYTSRRNYPAYHFALAGCGYSRTHQIAQQLRASNKTLEVYVLGEGEPSPVG